MIRVLSSASKANRLATATRTNSCRPRSSPALTQSRTFFFSKKDDDDDDDGASSKPVEKSSSTKSSSLTPSTFGSGDYAPRYPHLTGLPVVTRPLFPGSVTSVTLTDETTIHAMENLIKGNNSGYIGVFLRKQQPRQPEAAATNLIFDEKPEIITNVSDLYPVGTFAQITRLHRHAGSPKLLMEEANNADSQDVDVESSASLILLAHRRVDLISVDNLGPPVDVTVRHWDRQVYSGGGDKDDTIRALTNEVLSTIREVAQINLLFRESLAWPLSHARVDANDPYKLADFCASVVTSSAEELQAVLQERDAEQRLHLALMLLSKEREVSKLQKEISQQVEQKMTEQQRKYFLTEQLKSIKKELGMERDDKEALVEKYRKQLAEYKEIPCEVMETINAELEKLSTLEKNSAEFNVTRSYLDWLTSVPWGVTTEENFDIQAARKILDRDHYGLEEVKDTILQFIAVGKLRGSVQGKILCCAGPPGTGKTSIAESIAKALGRKFFRFSVGGLTDVSEIKGHRRTYVGAMPGKVIQCLKATESTNPLVLIDEIDKLGSGFRGDPASALLEVLDPSQNSTFRDHFLDVPVDISKVLFMCTANDLERIPGPLLDRMEVIRLSGYDFPEKVAIAEQYLVPRSMRESGLMVVKDDGKSSDDNSAEKKKKDEEVNNQTVTDKDVGSDESKSSEAVGTPLDRFVHAPGVPETLSITKSAIENLVRWYCREAGVRSLAKYVDKITGKLALQVVAEDEGTKLTKRSARKSDTWQIDEDNLSDYVGKQIFTHDRLYDKDPLPHGVVMGLAWTSMGGSALYIETQGIQRALDDTGKRRGGGTLKVTGQLGDVMKESSEIAYTVARAYLSEIDPKNAYLDEMDIHAHVPEGATPKDGPSAGITMVTSMLSLAMDKPVRNDLAMTGEVSLTGKVLAVGGIKEKIMGARRAGIKCIVLPFANQRDYDEIPDYLKEGLIVHFAEEYQTVFDVAFGTRDTEKD